MTGHCDVCAEWTTLGTVFVFGAPVVDNVCQPCGESIGADLAVLFGRVLAAQDADLAAITAANVLN